MTHGLQWRFARASVVGSSHVESGVPCQDRSIHALIPATFEPNGVLIMAASDGAGSAVHSDVGASIVCEEIVKLAASHLMLRGNTDSIRPEDVVSWFSRIVVALSREAVERDALFRDFACTLLFSVIGYRRSVFVQIGDGAIIDSNSHSLRLVFNPQRGEYANTTNFVTDGGASAKLEIEVSEHRPEAVAILTDGLQSLALDFNSMKPFEPFFSPLFSQLRIFPPGESLEFREKLTRFLGSPRVNERTDDDKTLILAART